MWKELKWELIKVVINDKDYYLTPEEFVIYNNI